MSTAVHLLKGLGYRIKVIVQEKDTVALRDGRVIETDEWYTVDTKYLNSPDDIISLPITPYRRIIIEEYPNT